MYSSVLEIYSALNSHTYRIYKLNKTHIYYSNDKLYIKSWLEITKCKDYEKYRKIYKLLYGV